MTSSGTRPRLGTGAGLGGLLLAAHSAWALTTADLPGLIATDERTVAHVQAPELLWAPDGSCLLVAGYTPGGQAAGMAAPLDGRPALPIPNLASTRVAFSPYGSRVVCWQRGAPSPTGDPQFLLSLFDPRVGLAVPVAGIAPFGSAPPVVWLSQPELVVTLRQQQEYTALVIYDPVAESLAPLIATVAGVGTVLRPSATPGHVVVGAAGLDGTAEYYLIDVRTGLVSMVEAEDALPTVPDATGRASPPGSAPRSGLIALCRQDGLFVSAPELPEPRRLLPRGDLGAHGYAATAPPVWSPTEEYIAYATRAEDGLADVRLVTLGLEELVCEVVYAPGSTPPAPGATVWVCLELQLDAQGRVVEPKWSTLKAQLEVTSSPLADAGRSLVRARSVGLNPDALKRLTGLSDPPTEMQDERSLQIGPAGAPPQTVLRSFSLPARSGLLAWSQGASMGQVVTVRVTRRALVLIGAPADAGP